MKAICLSAILAVVVAGCHNTTSQNSTNDSAPVQASPTTTVLSKREKLIQALQKLQTDMASHNKEAIAAYFRFPVENDVLQVFDVNTDFDKQLSQNNHLISRQLFLTHFDALYDNMEMRGFEDVFKHVQLNKLKDTATKQLEASEGEGMCTHSYSIAIEGDEVTLEYGVYTSETTTKKQQEDEEECAEYAAFWTFVFDGEQLIFNRHQVAG